MLRVLSVMLFAHVAFSQRDSSFIRTIYNEALLHGQSYENLRSLCKDVGNRLSGSTGAAMAVNWGEQKLRNYGFDSVYLEPVMVPHWERGTKEKAWAQGKDGQIFQLKLLALGGSIGTEGTLSGELKLFPSLEALQQASVSEVSGKIVFINQAMDETYISTLNAYGDAFPIRGNGAVEASKKGAKAVIIRSLASGIDDFPHTGTMHYEDSISKIPAAAISTQGAEQLANLLKTQPIQFFMEMDCKNLPPSPSYNVIAELRGSQFPKQIITVGGHLDSWDVGEGAHDDGAGIVHSMEALRLLNVLNYKPIHTIRVVFFMNEENGNQGGKAYAKWVSDRHEQAIAAIESDLGGYTPEGFSCDCSDQDYQFLTGLRELYAPYQVHLFEKGHSGVDISPLHSYFAAIPLYGFLPDSQRYFSVHHSENDVFEHVNKRELELGCGAIASLLYLIDQQKEPTKSGKKRH